MRIASFFEWFDLCRLPQPWLIVGKGPSFARRVDFAREIEEHNVLTLNDAIVHMPTAAVAHFVDWEAFIRCLPAIRHSDAIVAMPWHPHVEFRPVDAPLPELLTHPDVVDLAPRVYYYHASTARGRGRLEGEPLVQVKFFSAEAALSLLAFAGVKVVRTLGVDGGLAYAPEFVEAGLRPLENGARSFDAQFGRMERTAREHGMDVSRIEG